MLRQVSSRNHRAKGGFGFRAKNAFQVSILVAVCVWLLYQIKYSHDHSRKAYEDKIGADRGQSEIARFGRKEPLPRGVPAEDASAREDADEIKHEQRVAARADRDGKKEPVAAEDQEHEAQSHEAREKSFQGDDASSEVVHHGQELEHEEQTQEARERSFRADDVSSAVDHGAPLKEEVSDNSTSNASSSAVLEDALNATSFEKNKKKKKKKTAASNESDDNLEGESIVEIVANSDNGTDPRRFRANELENQRELGLRSRNLWRDHAAKHEDPAEEDGRNHTAVVEPKLLNQTGLHTNDTAKSSKGWSDKSKTSPVTGMALPLNGTTEEKRDEHGHTLQDKVESEEEEAAE